MNNQKESSRKQVRFSPKDFLDFELTMTCQDYHIKSILGNISESGLGAVIESMSGLSVGQVVSGTINGRRLPDPITFKGTVVWQTEASWSGYFRVGVQFEERIELNESVVALIIAANDSVASIAG